MREYWVRMVISQRFRGYAGMDCRSRMGRAKAGKTRSWLTKPKGLDLGLLLELLLGVKEHWALLLLDISPAVHEHPTTTVLCQDCSSL